MPAFLPTLRTACVTAFLLCGVLSAGTTSAGPDGKAVYTKKCASCHGKQGEGVAKQYDKPLTGDLSVGELTDYIVESMPQEEPEQCVGEEASAVAAYIHGAFYSPTAQARLKPPRIDLSRLTVRQYRNSVADLVGGFRQGGNWGEKRGLEGDYYKSRRRRRSNRVIERVDARVDFNFGKSSPDAEKIEPEEFVINWEGSVRPLETGEYEFVIATENAGRLWVNDMDDPLIDARVKSGDETEYRASVMLLGGRAYPLRLEYYKSKSEETSSIQLRWKPPHHAEEVIPARCLSPNRFPSVLVVETPFPPDDQSVGYERGVSVSKAWNDATTYAAIEVADKVLAQINELAGNGDDREQRIRAFCLRFAETAFRRPLTDEQTKRLTWHFEASDTPDAAARRCIVYALKSPRFLFPGVATEEFDDYRVASWLALALWDSLPDRALLEAAAAGRLHTREQISRQAERMVSDPRTRAKVREFFHQWLNYDRFHELVKDEDLYPQFNAEIASDLRTSLDLFVDEVVWSEDSDYRRLLLSDSMYLNGRLAEFYGAEVSSAETFEKVSLDPSHRAGLLSHPYMMAGLAYDDASSPIHRGVFLSRSLLGRFLKPPPVAVAPTPVDLHPDLTTRQRVELQTKEATCQACHGMINELGFSLEHFDAVGRFRAKERNRDVNARGSYVSRDGTEAKFRGARELAAFLVESPEAHAAFTEQLFQYLIKQPVQAFGPEALPALRNSFIENEFSVQHLLSEIATESAVRARSLRE